MSEYSATIEWLFKRLPMFQRQGGAAYKMDLSRTEALCAHLGHPEKALRVIHIAGTNGKGSLSHMWAAALQQHGYTTGLFTSPHLKDFRERIRINGIPISEEHVVEWVDKNRRFLEDSGMSFFEMNVGMALDIFQEEKVDFAVLEVGMGGRLDSTNIVDPELCVITNISMDHQAYLGNSRAQIAREKAGIIKKGVPVLIGESDEEVRPVFEEIADERGAPLFFAESMDVPDWPIALKGSYQEKNRRTFLASTQLFSSIGWKADLLRKSLSEGIVQSGLRGRWEILSESPLSIADTGHNEAAVRLIVAQLKSTTKKNWHVVWGMAEDKDISGILKLLPVEWAYYWCRPDVPRGLDANKLALKAKELGLNGSVQPDVIRAVSAAQSQCDEDEGVYIGGSTFVVAEVLD